MNINKLFDFMPQIHAYLQIIDFVNRFLAMGITITCSVPEDF